MPKIQTIKFNHEFKRAYYRGKKFHNPALVTYCVKNRLGFCRIGITTSKKIGNAVERNRLRRIIKAAFSSMHQEIDAGVDIVFVARFKTLQLKSTDIAPIMRNHLKLAGLLQDKD